MQTEAFKVAAGGAKIGSRINELAIEMRAEIVGVGIP